MKIALLSGAYGNAGDSLIESRSKALLEYAYKGTNIKVYSRKQLGEKFDEINSCDIVFFSGGPLYQKNISANFDIKTALKIKKPLKIIGGGWKGSFRSQQLPYNYDFAQDTFSLFKKINDCHGLMCRDLFSVKALHHNGLENAVMTGCPAWYDLERVHETKVHPYRFDNPIICVSDPAIVSNYSFVIPLLKHIKELFPSATIKFVLHRGLATPNHDEVCKSVQNLGFVEIVELYPDAKAFEVYDECDLHIGFRVHAHIYNLSRRQRSIVIEEDGRGGGVNEALGLPALLSYSDELQNDNRQIRKLYSCYRPLKNQHLLEQLDAYIDATDNAGNLYYENAYRLMKMYFGKMIEQLQK